MNILVVEDDEFKLKDLVDFISLNFPHVKVFSAPSMHSSWEMIRLNHYDLLFVDMTIPTYDPGAGESGGRPLALGGKELLERMDMEEIVVPTYIVTMFDEFGETSKITLDVLHSELSTQFSDSFRAIIYYHSALESWKSKILQAINLVSREIS